MAALRVGASIVASLLTAGGAADGRAAAPILPGTEALAEQGDLARLTNAGWHAFLERELARAANERGTRWARDLSSVAAYEQAIEPNRVRLRRAIGAVDPIVAEPRLEIIVTGTDGAPQAENESCRVWAVRWPAFDGVSGEGLLLEPRRAVTALVVLVPDADQTPEDLAQQPFALRLAARGARVVIPVLTNRGSRHAGDEALGIFTNQTQREWIYRQAALTGRHIIGYEVQKILAAVSALAADKPAPTPIGVIGCGEGGLLALYAAALDRRIDTAWVTGYFGPHEAAWREPLYRSIHGLAVEFDDAEIATLVAPRALVVETGRGPAVTSTAITTGPSHARSAAPGEIRDAAPEAVRAEWMRARSLAGEKSSARFHFHASPAGGGDDAFAAFWRELAPSAPLPGAAIAVVLASDPVAHAERERRTVRELQAHAQVQLRRADVAREEFFWKKAPVAAANWPAHVAPWREDFAREALGRIESDGTPARPRSRLLAARSTPRFATYEVMLDVAPGAIMWGLLLLPADLRPDERRAVIVCQHGSGGLPADTIEENPAARAHQIYQAYAARLAGEGFVVFAPYLINRMGGDDYRLIQRKADLLGLSFMSPVLASHRSLLAWLRTQPFVAPGRIGIYGMSYGSKAAIRAVAALDGYAVAVFSGDFNDNAAVIGTVRHDRNEAMFYPDYDLVEWDLARRFNYAEMIALFAPRPIMVEFGYADRAVQLEGAAAEFAKVSRLYAQLGVPERAAIEFFEGGHTVPGRGTFAFLRRWLR